MNKVLLSLDKFKISDERVSQKNIFSVSKKINFLQEFLNKTIFKNILFVKNIFFIFIYKKLSKNLFFSALFLKKMLIVEEEGINLFFPSVNFWLASNFFVCLNFQNTRNE